jgi:hypothetical protein
VVTYYDYDRRRYAGLQPTVGGFSAILTGYITQWDMQEQARASKKGRPFNLNALPLLLGAVHKAEAALGAAAKNDSDPETLERFKAAITRQLHDAPYVRKTIQQIDEYLKSGKAPRYPVQKKG